MPQLQVFLSHHSGAFSSEVASTKVSKLPTTGWSAWDVCLWQLVFGGERKDHKAVLIRDLKLWQLEVNVEYSIKQLMYYKLYQLYIYSAAL